MPHTDFAPTIGCDETLPEVSSDFCAPELKLSELNNFYFCHQHGTNFTDVSSPTEWAARMNDAGTVPSGSTGIVANDVIRHLHITGEYPKPAVSEKDISGGREKVPVRVTHTVNLDIDDITTENYQLAQTTQANIVYVKAWFKTKGGDLIGGNKGIIGRLRIDPVFGKGTDSLVGLTGTLVWITPAGLKSITPDIVASPI